MLLTFIGPEAFCRLQNLVSPAKLSDTAYQDLIDAMKKYTNTMPSVTVQRYKFNSHSRQPRESVSTYMSGLNYIAKFCDFCTLLDMLRDHIVCGINNEQIQRHLSENKLTLKRALRVAQSLEAAAQNIQTLQGAAQTTGTLGTPKYINSLLGPMINCPLVSAVERVITHWLNASSKMSNTTIVVRWDISSQFTGADGCLEDGMLIPYTQKFFWYVTFTDFTVNRSTVKFLFVKIYHLALFRAVDT